MIWKMSHRELFIASDVYTQKCLVIAGSTIPLDIWAIIYQKAALMKFYDNYAEIRSSDYGQYSVQFSSKLNKAITNSI